MADGHIAEQRELPLRVQSAPPPPEGNLDRLGVGISLGCAVHCLATGLLSLVPSLLPSETLGPWLERLEWPFFLGAAIVGVSSLAPAYRRHGEGRPLALFGVGMALLLGSRLVHGPAELGVTVSAVLTIATAHLFNLRACSVQHACAH